MKRSVPGAIGSLVLLVSSSLSTDAQQSLSCSYGSEPACLDHGAVVCKSTAKCVGNDAVCFDAFTCDYKGFVCKSKFDEAAEAYDNRSWQVQLARQQIQRAQRRL